MPVVAQMSRNVHAVQDPVPHTIPSVEMLHPDVAVASVPTHLPPAHEKVVMVCCCTPTVEQSDPDDTQVLRGP
jgi:hypothetical protein